MQDNYKKYIGPAIGILILMLIVLAVGMRQKSEVNKASVVKKRIIEDKFVNVDYAGGKFSPSEIIIRPGAQVNFFNKSQDKIYLISGVQGCEIELKPERSLGCVYKDIKTYVFEDKNSGAKGKIIVVEKL